MAKRRTVFATAVSVAIAILYGGPVAAGDPAVISLWPGTPPGPPPNVGAGVSETSEVGPGRNGRPPVRRIRNVTTPELHVFPASRELATGAGCVVVPGGGFNILGWDVGGTEVAGHFNALGITAAVVKYRVPTRGLDDDWLGPAIDVQRAVATFRSLASEYGVEADRVGLFGASAGGKTAAVVLARAGGRLYAPVDPIDDVSAAADFGVLLYPAYISDKQGRLRDECRGDAATGVPTFLAHAADDHITFKGSVALFTHLVDSGVTAELHVYQDGGHAFGMRPIPERAGRWMAELDSWLVDRGWGRPGRRTN